MEKIKPLIKQYEILSNWYVSATEGIDDTMGSKIINDKTNSLEWIAGHLNVGRYRSILRLGLEIEPYKYIDKFINQTLPPPNAIAFDKSISYPNLTENRQQWIRYSKILLDRLTDIDEQILKKELPFILPSGGKTVEDALVFMVLHETYHIGQMSIIRKALGYPGMQLNPKPKN